MKEYFHDLKDLVQEFGTAPTLAEMPRRTLTDKGINGPTAAHVIEEIHCPLNLAYLTFTTGSSAFQNIVGVTHSEIAKRAEAAAKALEKAGVERGDKILFTYPPLVNVFTKKALEDYGVSWSFLLRSGRDAFLSMLYEEKPRVIMGESSFIRASLEDADKMGLLPYLAKGQIILTAGTPLDLELIPTVERTIRAGIYDLYGCQEFGWLTLNGIPLRDDLSFVKSPLQGDYFEVVVGGLPMGDSFILSESGHVLNHSGKLITYRRERTYPEYEVIVRATPLSSRLTIERLARTVIRIKSRIVKVAPDVKLASEHTILELKPGVGEADSPLVIHGPEKTALFDDLALAQLNYQQHSKADPAWIKGR
ncbi:MAG: hypothetical protein ACOWWO_14675 [Peptococcaceae bacterium]